MRTWAMVEVLTGVGKIKWQTRIDEDRNGGITQQTCLRLRWNDWES